MRKSHCTCAFQVVLSINRTSTVLFSLFHRKRSYNVKFLPLEFFTEHMAILSACHSRTQYSIPLCGSSIFIQPVIRCDRLIGHFSYFPLQITMQGIPHYMHLFPVCGGISSRLIPRKDIASLKGYYQPL